MKWKNDNLKNFLKLKVTTWILTILTFTIKAKL
jgi:hypothetical protein